MRHYPDKAMFIENRKGFTLVEVMLAITIIIVIYLGATTAQISSEIFLKNIRADFERHLELNNALDDMIRDVRRGYSLVLVGGNLRISIRNPTPPPPVLFIPKPSQIIISEKGKPKVIGNAQFELLPGGKGVKIMITEVTNDPDKIKIVLISRAYLRDK